MGKSKSLFKKVNKEYIRYSAANVMKLEYSEMKVSILAIVIGLDKEKEKALILTHEIKKEGSQGKIIAREIHFKIDPEGKNKKDILNHLREKNDPIYSNFDDSIDSDFDDQNIVLTFLVGDDFESLYEEMPKYVNFHLYIEWYHIFYHDDFTPNFGTCNIVKYSLSNYNPELWESVNAFFKDNPKAIAYSIMPNVELTNDQMDELKRYKLITDNTKIFSLEKNSEESNYFSLKWGNKIYGLRESINYFNKTSYFTEK
uniref:Uncharacterized protein n=1 Tax=Rhabditophanes sp. KR3021 TaxID=114890 RepID=A0AC35UBH6_9BILA